LGTRRKRAKIFYRATTRARAQLFQIEGLIQEWEEISIVVHIPYPCGIWRIV
jgi:hypothetical protein